MKSNRDVEVDALDPQMELDQRLEINEPVGEGAMCVVLGAFDNNLLRTSAVKRLHPELAADRNTRRRMVEEAQITAQLDHPNIVPVYELGSDGSSDLFFTMKLVEGRTLTELLEDPAARRDQRLLAALQCLTRVCDAVAFAHSRGVIHRDLKPDNIMVGEYGEVYLMDWGIAKLRSQLGRDPTQDPAPDEPARPGRRRMRISSQDGKFVGTPYYMAPEQARGDHASTDERSDIFALGAILYEVLTGAPPFDGERLMEVLKAAARCEITPPEERTSPPPPARLCHVAMKALSPAKEERHQSAQEFKAELERFMQSGWHFPVASFEPGSDVVSEGEQGDSAYIIVEGTCRVYKRGDDGSQLELAQLDAGDVFGETSVFADEPRNATVRAVDRVTARVVPREYFEEDLGGEQSLGLFVRALARRFNDSNQRTIELEQELELSNLYNQVLKYLIFTGESTEEGRREARWSTLCQALCAQYKRDEDWLMAVVQDDPLFEVDIGRDVVSVGRL